MSTDILPVIVPPATVAIMQQDDELILEFAQKSKSRNTWKSYQSDCRHFEKWCSENQHRHFPADAKTVATYLLHLRESHKLSTLSRRIAAISQAHFAAGLENPTLSPQVKMTMKGLRNEYGAKQTVRRMKPAVSSIIHKLLDPLGDSLIDSRDRALILIGFAGAFRRSELAQLQLADISVTVEGLRIVLRKSKTDQEGQGYAKGIAYGSEERTCPVRAWQTWLTESAITEGMAFRSVQRQRQKPRRKDAPQPPIVMGESISDRTIANIIKRRAASAGLDARAFSGHSLRAGLITEAARRGKPERAIMKQSGHKHLPTLREYIREGSLFMDNVSSDVGL